MNGVQVTAVCSDVELVTGTRAGQLARWRCDGGAVVHYLARDDQAGARWTAHDAAVCAVDVLRSRHWLLSASADCMLRVWDLASNLLLQTLRGHDDQVSRIRVRFDHINTKLKRWKTASKRSYSLLRTDPE